ncbi:E3 ubiquitin-protein ligase UPL5-like [Solanum dulcamara]|uniref:E3 ubiquitin-protein ligase UPL5-like n=1 Tax=Solanum dulcamara TaxID=45834 RepID=UPI002486882F|nr:E3 ubiquitin-protein ligase UPL5-like [Solanum dulcamara]
MIDADTINQRKLDQVSSDQASSSCIGKRKRSNDPTPIQFFVRSFPKGETIVIRAHSTDPVESIHNKIMGITGIPALKERLIYQGKELELDKTLEDYAIQHDTTIQLVIGRMPSTDHPQAWQLIDDLVSVVFDILKSNDPSALMRGHHIIRMLKQFFAMTPMDNIEESFQYLQIFISSSAPAALVMLYISADNTKKYIAHESIHRLINSLKSTYLPKHRYNEYARLVFVFCKLLRSVVGLDDPLYRFCQSSIVEFTGVARHYYVTKELSALNDAFLFVRDVVVAELSRELELSMGSVESTELSWSIVPDFTEYMCLVRGLLQQPFDSPIESVHHILSDLHLILYDLLDKIELCLRKMEDQLGLNDEGRPIVSWWSQYLVILKELNNISKLFNNSEVFWEKITQRKVSLCFLIVTFAKSFNDYQWVIEHKEVTNFEVRRHFAMMMLEEARCGEEDESYEMLIDRSRLLEESFQYIVDVDPELLRGDLLMEFEHEEATGPGVLREWFFLVCRELFNPQMALFMACPNDRRRFLPNPASKVDPLHLEYFSFCGRMIALALMHKIQIGVVFDRVFFLQLAGEEISLEDIRDADPSLYSSCKQILEMDPETVDQDILSLVFVCDAEEFGSKITIELCPNGKDTVVNSKNRKEYVNLLIQHRFITSIAPQIAHFSQGFADITTLSIQTCLFRSLDLEDLDQMLDGSGSEISIEDWKAHTDYNGYEESDHQISWFWKIVECMSGEKRKALLFFWTSIKYLPLQGFGGLDSRLSICRTSESCELLPSAQTCFYQMRVPPYGTRALMQERLDMITQEHIGCSFGIR